MPIRRATRRALGREIGCRVRPRITNVLTAAVTRPASSSRSNTVSTCGERWSRFRLTRTSSIICRVPSASVAAIDEPYSTNRPSPRWYQVMLGIREPLGCRPVISADRHTGVSEGKVEQQRSVRDPSEASQSMVGAAPAAIERSSRAGPSPSITASISFLGTGRAGGAPQRRTRSPSYLRSSRRRTRAKMAPAATPSG